MVESGDSRQLLIGKITGAHGIKGWVKVFSFTDPVENIIEYLPWDMTLGQQVKQYDVEDGRLQGKGLAVKLKGIDDRNAAEALKGAEIYIDREQLPTLAEDEFYWDDLIGLTVIDQNDVTLGKVDHMLDTGANDVLVVEGDKRCMIPYISGDVVKSVELDEGVIRVDWLEPE